MLSHSTSASASSSSPPITSGAGGEKSTYCDFDWENKLLGKLSAMQPVHVNLIFRVHHEIYMVEFTLLGGVTEGNTAKP